MQVYTANETADQNVWFDDLKVTFTPQLIVQENHYYPFGLEMHGIEKENKPEHRWKFSGVENEDNFGLNWIYYRYRSNYNPQTARFFSVDPIAEEYIYLTPYQHASNNPASKIEIEGLEGQWVKDLVFWVLGKANPNAIRQTANAVSKTKRVLKYVERKTVQGAKFLARNSAKAAGTAALVLAPTNYSATPETDWHKQRMKELQKGLDERVKKGNGPSALTPLPPKFHKWPTEKQVEHLESLENPDDDDLKLLDNLKMLLNGEKAFKKFKKDAKELELPLKRLWLRKERNKNDTTIVNAYNKAKEEYDENVRKYKNWEEQLLQVIREDIKRISQKNKKK